MRIINNGILKGEIHIMAVNLNKITLDKKGQSSKINLVKKQTPLKNIKVKLSWTKAVDLDMHAFYIDKNDKAGHVYFGNKRDRGGIQLDKDAGVGNTAGNNEENLTVQSLEGYKYILFATNIFRLLGFLHRNDRFSSYDGKVIVSTDQGIIEVPLNANEKGKWAAIAMIDNTGEEPKVININEISNEQPDIMAMIHR